MAASTNAAKMRQHRTRAARYIAQRARTERNKLKQQKAREKLALRRMGLAIARRDQRRTFLKEKRRSEPNYARALPPPEPKISSQAFNQDSRGISRLIFSTTCTPYK